MNTTTITERNSSNSNNNDNRTQSTEEIRATWRFDSKDLIDLKHLALDKRTSANTLMNIALKTYLSKELGESKDSRMGSLNIKNRRMTR